MDKDRGSNIRNLTVWLGALLILGILAPGATLAAHKVPSGYPPFAYPVAPPANPPVAQADAITTPAPTIVPTPAPAGGLTLDRFTIGLILIAVGTLGAALAGLGLRRARRLRDAALSTREPPAPKL
jgi:hypothetical protein